MTPYFLAKPLFIFFFIYLAGLTLGRIIPETLAQALTGYFLGRQFMTPELLTSIFGSINLYLLIILAFNCGADLPWHKANLFRNKLYKTSLTAFSILLGLFLLFFIFIDQANYSWLSNLKSLGSSFFFLLFSCFLISTSKISIQNKKKSAHGPLSSAVWQTAAIFNILCLLILSPIIELPQQNLLIYILKSAGLSGMIIGFLYLLKFIAKLKKDEFLYKSMVLLLIYFSITCFQASPLLVPLLTGMLISLQYKGELKILPRELIKIVNNGLILLAAPLFILKPEILLLALGFILFKNICFRLIFRITGQVFNFNETVYKNLGAGLTVQNATPIALVMWVAQKGFIPLENIAFWFSVLILIIVFENVFFKFQYNLLLRQAGETNN